MSDPTLPDSEHRFPCPQCGADMRFAPGGDTLVCDHCGFTQSVEGAGARPAGTVRELDLQAALDNRLPPSETVEARMTRCPNCGAAFEFGASEHARTCPFCATPVVVDTGTERHLKPQGVLPFSVSEQQARDAMTRWLGALWFAPNGLQEYARKGRKLDGIYVPYWTYDADTKSRYRGERGTYYYTTRTVVRNGKNQTVRERHTRWTSASGRVARFFDDVLVLASTSLPKRYTDALEPWDLHGMQDYRPEFLAGFRAESYTVDIADGWKEARAHMAQAIENDVRADIGGDEQRVHDVDTQVSDTTFKHVLLPVWLAAYKYGGRSFRFVVNGRTGEVQGERPWSKWKVAFAVLLALIAAGVAAYLYDMYQ
jgi:predicted RNA-binding Zn-ribbon protein involved in translation (DUF1610 family)